MKIKRRKYNKELINWLNNNAKNYIVKDLVKLVNKKYNENFNDKSIRKLLYSNRIEYKYTNKNKSHNMSKLPIGYEYTKSDGMVLVKIGRNELIYKQRLIYEQYHKVKLNSDEYVIFLDQDRTNFNINNLKVVTNRESSILSNQKIFSSIPEITETGIQVAKLIIKTKDLERKI